MKTFWRILLFLYVPFVALAVLLAFADPPTGRGNHGVFAVIASVVAGLPWSALVVLIHEETGFANSFGVHEDLVLVWLCLACTAVNVWWLARRAFDEEPAESFIAWAGGRLPIATIVVGVAVALVWLVGQGRSPHAWLYGGAALATAVVVALHRVFDLPRPGAFAIWTIAGTAFFIVIYRSFVIV